MSKAQLGKFLPQLESEGINMVYLDPKDLSKTKTKLNTIHTSNAAKYVVLDKENSAKSCKNKKDSQIYYQCWKCWSTAGEFRMIAVTPRITGERRGTDNWAC